MRKVKKGSALLNVLMITMILTMTAGIVTTAVVQTTKGNAYKKVTDDLTYAAESGIQQAISNVDNMKYQSMAVGSTTSFNIDDRFTQQDIKVNVEIKKNLNNSTYDVKSVSTKTVDGKTRERTVKAVIKKVPNVTFGTDNLFRFSLCGNSTYIYHTGSFNPDSTLVNGSEGVYCVNAGAANAVTINSDNKNYIVPEFDKIPYQGDKLKITKESDLDTLVGLGQAVKRSFTPTYSAPFGRPVDMYLVNTDNLIYEYSDVPPTLNNKIIISSGNFTVIHKDDISKVGADGLPHKDTENEDRFLVPAISKTLPFSLQYSSVIAKNANLYIDTIHLGAPIYTDAPPAVAVTGAITDKRDIEELNKIVQEYSSTWASDNVVDGTVGWGSTEVDYE